jgi:hypothetical protein
VILIDDIRYFDTFNRDIYDHNQIGYPDINFLCSLLYNINESYKIIVFGDCLIAYPSNLPIIASPLLEAFTLSRLFNGKNYELEKVHEAEQIIAQASDEVFYFMNHMQESFNIHNWGIAKHYAYWAALMLLQRCQYGRAYELFIKVADQGLQSPAIEHYMMIAKDKMSK